ncbi:MAG TPA: oligosaccharide flippase family protein [Polyangiales bacterium]
MSLPPSRLKLNLVVLYGAEAVSKVLGLAVFGYLGRTLARGRYGDLEFAIGVLSLLNLVQDAGLPSYAARENARDPSLARGLAGQVFVIRAGILGLSLVVLSVTAWLSRGDPTARTLLLLYGLVLMPTPFDLGWSFQARDDMRVVAISSVLRQIVLAGGTFALVHGPQDVTRVPILDATGLSLAVLLQQIIFRRREGGIEISKHLAGVGRVLRECLPIAGSAVVWALRLYSPLLALGVFTTSEQTGVFAASHRLVVSLHTFVWLYFFNLLPSISRVAVIEERAAYRRLITASFTLVSWVVLLGASLGTVLAPALIPLVYGPGLAAASGPFAVMVWMLAAAFLSGHHRFSLIAWKHQTHEFWAAAIGALVSLAGSAILGHALTPASAALVFVCAEVTTLICAHLMLANTVEALPLLALLGAPLLCTALALGTTRTLHMSPWPSALATLLVFGVVALSRWSALRTSFADLQVAVRGRKA